MLIGYSIMGYMCHNSLKWKYIDKTDSQKDKNSDPYKEVKEADPVASNHGNL